MHKAHNHILVRLMDPVVFSNIISPVVKMEQSEVNLYNKSLQFETNPKYTLDGT